MTPLNCPGWLEEELMGRARRHLVNRLRNADTHGKFRRFMGLSPPAACRSRSIPRPW